HARGDLERARIHDGEKPRGAVGGEEPALPLVGRGDSVVVPSRVGRLGGETADRFDRARRRIDHREHARASRGNEQPLHGGREPQVVESDPGRAPRDLDRDGFLAGRRTDRKADGRAKQDESGNTPHRVTPGRLIAIAIPMNQVLYVWDGSRGEEAPEPPAGGAPALVSADPPASARAALSAGQ